MNLRDINPTDFERLIHAEEKIKFLLRYAILAPSTHNSQPWLFRVDPNGCVIFFDEKYLLPEADPKRRDLFISIGCLLENLTIAAKFFGVFGSLDINVNLNTRRVATFLANWEHQTVSGGQLKELLNTIPKRINARGFFNTVDTDVSIAERVRASVPQEYANQITVTIVTDKKTIGEVAELTAVGLRAAYRRKAFRREMSRWLKNSLTLSREGLPGYALRVPFLLSFFLPTIVRHKDIGGKLAKLNKESFSSAPILILLSSKESAPTVWVRVGMVAQRMMLDFNARGLNTSIFVASIEMEDLHKELKKVLSLPDEPQFLFVVGRVDKLHKYTPRHGVMEKLI